MMIQSVKLAIKQTIPTTKAAKLRQVLPEIEQQLAAGVRLESIHKVLEEAGFGLTVPVLRTYLHRLRKEKRSSTREEEQPVDIAAGPTYVCDANQENASDGLSLHQALSMQEIESLIRPDPTQQAEKIAHYERLAKQQRRSRE